MDTMMDTIFSAQRNGQQLEPEKKKRRPPHREGVSSALGPRREILTTCAVLLPVQVNLVGHREKKDRQGDV
jgi:hypothetical protein